MGEHPNELLWFRHESGTLSLLEKGRFHGHLLTCARCRARRDAAIQEREQLERSGAWEPLPFPRAAGQPALPRRPAVIPRWTPWALSAAAVGLLLVLSVQPVEQEVDALRPKGGSVFEVLQTSPDGQAQPLGKQCAAGQLLQARYKAEHPWLLVINVDGAGKAAVLFPFGGSSSTQTTRGGNTLLPLSFTLDAAPGTERFVAFFSEQPLVAEAALVASRTASPRMEGAQVVVVECEKVSR